MKLNRNPCEECVITAMCKYPCHEYADYLKKELLKQGFITDFIYIAAHFIRNNLHKGSVIEMGKERHGQQFHSSDYICVEYNKKGTIHNAFIWKKAS